MNDILSITADILTTLGALVNLTLEIRRARREARRTTPDGGKAE
ncbi:hypothetical protein ACFUJU_30665 [Streptomyces sp. NPDC057235]